MDYATQTIATQRMSTQRTAGGPYRRRRQAHVMSAERSEIAMTAAHSLSAVACVTVAIINGKPKNGVGVSVGVIHWPVRMAFDAAIYVPLSSQSAARSQEPC